MSAPPIDARQRRRAVLASFLGAMFEWYDFQLYVTVSALVFNSVFFPTKTPAVGTLLALTTTAVGFVTRPLGAIIFGHLGDRIGRRTLLVATMLLMGIPTVLIGLLPGYATIGVAAPVILCVLRLLQGIGLGGEYAGAALTTIESAPGGRRGFFGSIAQLGNPIGILLVSAMVLIFSTAFPGAVFARWAWRLPFLISVILLVYALIARLRLVETADFALLKDSDRVQRFPLGVVIRRHWRTLLLTLGARSIDVVSGNMLSAVLLAYIVTYLKLPSSIALVTAIVYGILAIGFMPLVGRLGDRLGRKRIFVIGIALVGVLIFPFFALLHTKIIALMCVGIFAFRFANGTQFSVQSAVLAESFPTEVRYTGLSLAYQVTAVFGGLVAPAAFAILVASHGSPWILAAAVSGIALLSILCAAALRTTTVPASSDYSRSA